jgi:hypothetical protein
MSWLVHRYWTLLRPSARRPLLAVFAAALLAGLALGIGIGPLLPLVQRAIVAFVIVGALLVIISSLWSERKEGE